MPQPQLTSADRLRILIVLTDDGIDMEHAIPLADQVADALMKPTITDHQLDVHELHDGEEDWDEPLRDAEAEANADYEYRVGLG